jgi:excinuclease ABC subunit B
VASAITSLSESLYEADYVTVPKAADLDFTPDELRAQVAALREEMRTAAEDLDFERAADIRDRIKSLEEGALLAGYEAPAHAARSAASPVRRPRGSGRGGPGGGRRRR